MIKVVADTNIYISAVLFGGNSEKITKLAREGKIELLISENILAEIAGVLKRKFNWFDWQVSELIKDIRAITTLVTPVLSLSVIKEDEPDNRFLECAIEGKAQYIISGDKHHLQPLKEYQGIMIKSCSIPRAIQIGIPITSEKKPTILFYLCGALGNKPLLLTLNLKKTVI